MPFFDADKFTVGVQVDSHHAAIVGGSIAGTLTIDCAEESSLRTITMKYRVKEYRLRAPRHMEVTATEAKSLGFQYKAKMHSVEYVMLGGSDNPEIQVPRGHYAYPFNIPVPHYLPPTTDPSGVGKGSRCCCCRCCCECCGSYTNVVRVVHRIKVTLSIPYSMRDKKGKWDLVVLRPVDAQVHAAQSPDSRFFDIPAFHFASCCGCCAGCFEIAGQRHCFTLTILNPIVALEHDSQIRYRLDGLMRSPFDILLIRRSILSDDSSKIGEDVLAVSQFPATPLAHLDRPVVEGSLFLVPHEVRNVTTFASATIRVEHFVTVRFHYTTGVLAGNRERDRVEIPVLIYHCFSQGGIGAANVPGANLGAMAYMNYVPTVEGTRAYAYVAPEQYASEHHPVAAVAPPTGLPEAVWGTVVGPLPPIVAPPAIANPAVRRDTAESHEPTSDACDPPRANNYSVPNRDLQLPQGDPAAKQAP